MPIKLDSTAGIHWWKDEDDYLRVAVNRPWAELFVRVLRILRKPMDSLELTHALEKEGISLGADGLYQTLLTLSECGLIEFNWANMHYRRVGT